MTLALRSDVLVIGGGLAGSWAAIAAARAGAEVILAEKGYVGTSGVTATAGPGHWWVPPDPALREAAIGKRLASSAGLGDAEWMARILDLTWRTLPELAPYYDFARGADGTPQMKALRGPEYLRALRLYATRVGVTILDHAPALELVAADGAIVGAAGIRRQHDEDWDIRCGAVILATGGCGFRSHLLGSANNTGDGLLMAVEAGAVLSGMEFSAYYTVAPLRTTMTRSMSYAFATWYDAQGQVLPIAPGPDQTEDLARALLRGPVRCDLGRMPDDLREILPHISPNVVLPFRREGIDPFTQPFEVTLRAEGTIRGVGGVRVADRDCGSGIDGLYVAGDVASREDVTGAVSGGGAVNSSWAVSSGQIAGRAAAAHARRARQAGVGTRLGEAGLRPLASGSGASFLGSAEAIASVRAEMLPLDRNLFRSGPILEGSLARLDQLWAALREGLADMRAASRRDRLRTREAASLVAAARWCYGAAAARTESRGLHRRIDHPATDPGQAFRIETGGLDRRWTRRADTGRELPA